MAEITIDLEEFTKIIKQKSSLINQVEELTTQLLAERKENLKLVEKVKKHKSYGKDLKKNILLCDAKLTRA